MNLFAVLSIIGTLLEVVGASLSWPRLIPFIFTVVILISFFIMGEDQFRHSWKSGLKRAHHGSAVQSYSSPSYAPCK
jgi:hypothetical protein